MVGLEGAVAGTPGGVGLSAAPAQAPAAHQGSERGTRARIARLILEHGPATAAGRLCPHQCPVAHGAAEYPQLCEAETEAFGRLLGTPVQRLATIAHGDGLCTTHVTAPSLVHSRTTTTGTTTTESGGISA